MSDANPQAAPAGHDDRPTRRVLDERKTPGGFHNLGEVPDAGLLVGVDLGNTDINAVLMAGDQVCSAVTQSAVPAPASGVAGVLRLLVESDPRTAGARAVIISTSRFETAVAVAEGLTRTGCIRLCNTDAETVPPLAGWPATLRIAVGEHVFLCRGGHEFDGAPIQPLDEQEFDRVATILADSRVGSVAITSVFSPVNSEAELAAASLLRDRLPTIRSSLSHEIGSIGLLERENATIINAALLSLAEEVATVLTHEVASALPGARVYLAQNDGTVMELSFARLYPVFTFWAGHACSMRGAAMLSGRPDCVVVDLGTTTTNVGVVSSGYPQLARHDVSLAGVRTNLRRPETLSVPFGSMSIVTHGNASAVGPASSTEDALAFEGPTLTTTDVTVAAGGVRDGKPLSFRRRNQELVRRSLAAAMALIDEAVLTADPGNSLPVVLVGQGAAVAPEALAALRPEHGEFARAVGAASMRIGGEVDRIIAGDSATRASAIEYARSVAVQKAVMAGAAEQTIRVIEVDEIPLAYLPGDLVRVRIKAVGDLA